MVTTTPTDSKAMRFNYIRDPAEIYRRSFAAVREAADLSGLAPEMEDVGLRLIHASGMPKIVRELAFSDGAADVGRAALAAGASVLVDVEMVAAGIIRDRLPAANRVICTLGDTAVAALAREYATTHSAAAVEFWKPHLAGSVVAIGTAPTALYRLLELIGEGADKPALVLGFPVGFIGAVESKQALSEHAGGVPFITLHGRLGGSALAAAAVNALAGKRS